MEASNSKGIFINGKQQMVELLQYLEGEEKTTLIENLYKRNPAMAKELMENSLSFENIYDFNDEQILLISRYIKPAIWGLALKFTNRDFQRRVLSLIPRETAEVVYGIFAKNISNETRDSKRAKNKIVDVVISLSKKKVLAINP